jgi:mono/diheme cytochrome c family protein
MADLLAYLYFVQYMGHSGDATHGAQVFRDKSCSGCHAVRGEGPKGAADLSASAAVRSPFHWTAAMWNHTAGVEKKDDEQQPAWPRFDDDQMRDLVEFLRSPGAAK